MPDHAHSNRSRVPLPDQPTDVIDCLPDAVAIVDDSGTIRYVNGHLAAMFGFECGELVGQPIEVLVPERFRQRHVEQRAAYGAEPHRRANSDDLALYGKRKDGGEFPVDVALNPFSAPGRKSVLVTIRDISRRKQLEQGERAAREMLAAVVESSPVAIVGLAPDRQVLVWNRVAEEIFERSGNGTTGQPVKLTSDAIEVEEDTLVERALAGETLRDIPVQCKLADGSLRHVSFSCAPMRGRDGRIQGVALALQDITERRKTEAELIRLARTDPLTGLLNRRAFFERLEFTLAQARRSDLGCAIIMFDIDNFKEINDLFGHKAGDSLLIAIAKNVKKELRETDSIARIGGDEFAVLAPNLRSAGAAMEVAEKIVGAVRSIRSVDDARVEPSISVGISVYPMDDNPVEVLVSHADMAMYISKTRKKGSVNFFDSRMDESVKERHALKRSMPDDIADGRFYLLFQAIVDAETREIVGAEGLARWGLVEGKIVQPAQFIPIAEESGLIASLGNRLFEDACSQIRQWDDAGKRTVPISLNISPLQLRDPGFGVELIAKMEKLGIDPRCINIEITESTIIKNLSMMRRNLDTMKQYGVGIHIDDFGTGYSSLSVLKDLPLDVLKIDRSFVRGLGFEAGAESIVQAVVELSKKLGFRTIAEGVETEEQVGILHRIGVDCMQGFFFSRPVEAKELAGRLGGGDSHLLA